MNYQIHYERLIKKARQNLNSGEYFERHHVIPKCLNGGDEETNLVELTAREHYIAHLLLAKMLPEDDLINAAVFVGNRCGFKIPKWLKEMFRSIASKNGKRGGHIGGKLGNVEGKRRSGLMSKELKTGFHNPEVYKKAGAISGNIASARGQIQELQLKVASMAGSASCKKRNAIRLTCEICGFKGNAGHQGKHRQRTGCVGRGV